MGPKQYLAGSQAPRVSTRWTLPRAATRRGHSSGDCSHELAGLPERKRWAKSDESVG